MPLRQAGASLHPSTAVGFLPKRHSVHRQHLLADRLVTALCIHAVDHAWSSSGMGTANISHTSSRSSFRYSTAPTGRRGCAAAPGAAAGGQTSRVSTQERQPRSAHKSNTDVEMIARPIMTKPAVTRTSCRCAATCPAAVIGESAAVPKMAAIVVTAQLPYVPTSNDQ
jgi:hypothetical protein